MGGSTFRNREPTWRNWVVDFGFFGANDHPLPRPEISHALGLVSTSITASIRGHQVGKKTHLGSLFEIGIPNFPSLVA